LKHLKQDKFYNSLDRRNEPTLKVRPGQTFVVDTIDNVHGRVQSEKDSVPLADDYMNPVSGPIYVAGARKGDTLVVHIGEIKIPERGWSGFRPEWIVWDTRGVKQPSPTVKICKIRNGVVYYPLKDGSMIEIPARPLIGTIGTAPQTEGIISMNAGRHGGNIDCTDVCAGNTLFLPIFVEGGLLHLGDVHAAQGDGELNGAPVEVSAECTLTVDVLKGKVISCPRIETPTSIMTIGIGRNSIDEALKMASAEMVEWLCRDYGFDTWDASHVQSLIANARICAAVDPDKCVAVVLPKKYLCAKP
jgi:acetamidase/formamidase